MTNKKLAQIGSLFQDMVPDSALDVGCAVGRSTFELARAFSRVVGVDYSNNFIATCNDLKESGHQVYSMTSEGLLSQKLVAAVDNSIVRFNYHTCKPRNIFS